MATTALAPVPQLGPERSRQNLAELGAPRPPDRGPALRPFVAVATPDQWLRASHLGTSLDPSSGAVQLAWEREPASAGDFPEPPPGAGLAFDPWCRLYRSLPEPGRVERTRWAAGDPLEPFAAGAAAADLFAQVSPAELGDFQPQNPADGPLEEPRGLVVDDSGRLFIAESGAGRVLVFDLLERRLLRRLSFPAATFGGGRPVDLATDGRRVWALLEAAAGAAQHGLAVFDARGPARPVELPAAVLEAAVASRLAASPAGTGPVEILVLVEAGSDDALVVPLSAPGDTFTVPLATDLEFQDAETLVVARRGSSGGGPSEDFRVFAIAAEGVSELPALKARGYDGRGLVRTPDGRIAFFSDLGERRGLRTAVRARQRFARRGRVVTFRLDAGHFQARWGRLFLDACLPEGTRVRVHSATADEPPGPPDLPRLAPCNTVTVTVHRPDLSPPMPPLQLAPFQRPELLPAACEAGAVGPEEPPLSGRLHRRETGREQPWTTAPEDVFETYETPVHAPPGRYLWVTLELGTDGTATPRVRALRAETEEHALLASLPGVFSRPPQAADFLGRFLASPEGSLADLDARAFARRALVDPESAPEEHLGWLASFVGLVLDERWSEASRRRAIAEAIWLFRFRGTVAGLTRFLQIALESHRRPLVIEHFRTRGLGGAVVGADTAAASSSVLGGGFRVGGKVGTSEVVSLDADEDIETDPFAAHAHRFSVVLPASLDAEGEAMVRHLLDEHRPAHTLYDLCTVDAGMKLGIGLYIELTSLVGRSSGFDRLQLGATPLGRTAVLGRPGPGTRPGSGRLGADTRVG